MSKEPVACEVSSCLIPAGLGLVSADGPAALSEGPVLTSALTLSTRSSVAADFGCCLPSLAADAAEYASKASDAILG